MIKKLTDSKKSIDYTYIFLIVIILLSFIPLYIMSFYSHPMLDDWTYSLLTHAAWNESHNVFKLFYEALRTVWKFWNEWQGTYSSAFVMSLQPSLFGEDCYFITGILYLTMLIGSTVFFFCYICRKIFSDKKRATFIGLIVGLICSFFSFQYALSAAEGFYWFNGATHYALFHSLILIFICGAIELQITDKKIKYLILCSLLGVFMEGGNHVTAFMTLLFMVVLIVWKLINKKGIQKENVILLLVLAVFFCINAFSPGNGIRKESYGEFLSFFEIIAESKDSAMFFVSEWANIKTLIMIALLIPAANEIANNTNYEFKYPITVFALSLVTIGIMITPVMYGQKNVGSARTANIYYYTFILLAIINEIYIIGYLKRKEILNIQKTNYLFFPVLVLVLLVGLFWTSGEESYVYKAITELSNGTAQASLDAYRERLDIIEDAKDDEIIAFEPLPYSDLLWFYDLDVNPGLWPNYDFSEYHGIAGAYITRQYYE